MVMVNGLLNFNKDLNLMSVAIGGLCAIIFLIWAYKIDGGQADG